MLPHSGGCGRFVNFTYSCPEVWSTGLIIGKAYCALITGCELCRRCFAVPADKETAPLFSAYCHPAVLLVTLSGAGELHKRLPELNMTSGTWQDGEEDGMTV